MVRPRNTARAALATLAGLVAAPAAGAEALPDPADVTGAFLQARAWLREFRLPPPGDADAGAAIRGCGGVCMILRSGGRVLGTGVDAGSDNLALRRAAGRAFGEALGHPLLADLPDSLRATAGARMTLELEVAGELQALPVRSLSEAADLCEPGLDGLALRRGEQVAMLFPTALLAVNRADELGRVAPTLAAEVGVTLIDPAGALPQGAVTAYRFQTLQLAQSAPGGTPFPLTRGQVVVGSGAVTGDGLRALADAIATHIIEVLPWRSPEDSPQPHLGLLGEYQPASDTFDPLLATPLEQALVAFALGRYASAPGIDAATGTAARELGGALLEALARVGPGEPEPLEDLAAVAALVYAGSALRPPGAGSGAESILRAARDRVRRVAVEAQVPEGLDPHASALLAGAASRLLLDRAADLDPRAVQAMIDRAWAAVPPFRRTTLLPWIAWAEWDLLVGAGLPASDPSRLPDLHAGLERARVRATDGVSADLPGAFALASASSPRADPRRATSQSLRPAAYVATALRRMPSGEAALVLPAHMESVRYLMQITVRPDCAWSLRNPARAVGGVRASTWDNRLPVGAAAMGLLVAAETLVSLEGAGLGPRGIGPEIAPSGPVRSPFAADEGQPMPARVYSCIQCGLGTPGTSPGLQRLTRRGTKRESRP
jgi:hypothetical protein